MVQEAGLLASLAGNSLLTQQILPEMSQVAD